VIEDVGLCIELYDVLEISQGTVYAGDGGAFATVKFRMIVFKPFVGELLVGSIKSQDQNGVMVTFDFFDQVIVPPGFLQPESAWNGEKWYWNFGEHRLWMSIGDQVRVRIEKITFNPPESKRYVFTPISRQLNVSESLHLCLSADNQSISLSLLLAPHLTHN